MNVINYIVETIKENPVQAFIFVLLVGLAACNVTLALIGWFS